MVAVGGGRGRWLQGFVTTEAPVSGALLHFSTLCTKHGVCTQNSPTKFPSSCPEALCHGVEEFPSQLCPGWGLGPSCGSQGRIPGLSSEGLPLHPRGTWPCLAGACGCSVPIHPSALSCALLSPAADGAGGCANPPGRFWRSSQAALSRAVPCPAPGDTRGPGDTRVPPWPCAAVSHTQPGAGPDGGGCPETPGVVAVGSRATGVPALGSIQRKRGRRGSLMPPGREDHGDDNALGITSVPTAGRSEIGWGKGSIPVTSVPQMPCGAAPAGRDELGSVVSLQSVPWGTVTVTTQLAGSEQWRGLLVTNGTRGEDGRRSQGCS